MHERKKRISINLNEFVFAVGGQLYSQAPNHKPRKVDAIMTKARDKFKEKCSCHLQEFHSANVAEDELETFIRDILFSIPEFEELNLSQIEFENGVGVNDDDRTKFLFTSAYDTVDWKNDFVDLDAYVRNVIRQLCILKNANLDCFCCIHAETEKCNNCVVNGKLTNNYECGRQPKGEYTFACKYDCVESSYICCEECKKQDKCEYKCKKCSKDCGYAINHKNEK